ncbi:hypothetical protein GDO86_019065, partial [Hymenochirus boettgeri]
MKEKPGRCPVDVDFPRCEKPKDPECSDDSRCPGKSKCCFSGCKNRCLLPLEDKLDSCPSFDASQCVLKVPVPGECYTDDQCPGAQRCCCYNCRHQCMGTVKVKSGQCPSPSRWCPVVENKTECRTDADCSENKKCCKSCGQKCVNPLL